MTRLTMTLAASTALTALAATAHAQEELNALVWCDHTDDALIEPFEAAHDVEVNLREYEGTGAALALLEQSRPGDWDVLVIDGIDVFRAVEAGILAPLPADELPTEDFFPEVVMAENNAPDGTTYAVTENSATTPSRTIPRRWTRPTWPISPPPGPTSMPGASASMTTTCR